MDVVIHLKRRYDKKSMDELNEATVQEERPTSLARWGSLWDHHEASHCATRIDVRARKHLAENEGSRNKSCGAPVDRQTSPITKIGKLGSVRNSPDQGQ